ncbi:MAG TPA: hypothetical protein VNM48_23260 [Chloroflexota bacterium]|nr:hypothetical protein [Chloroflexota bacterium]
MEQKLDKVLDKLDSQGTRLTLIEADLRHHIKRTDDLQALAEEFKRYKWMVMGAVLVLGPVTTRLLTMYIK